MRNPESAKNYLREYIAGILFAIGMPFAHLAGYISGVLALPSLLRKECREKGRLILLPLLVLIVYWAVRSIFVDAPKTALIEIPDALLSWVLPFTVGISIAGKRDELLRLYAGAWFLIIIASLVAGTGIFPRDNALVRDLWREGMIWALHHHNDFAACMVIILPVLAYKSLSSGKRGWWAVTVASFVGLILSGSRGYYIAFIPTLLGYTVMELKHKRIRTYVISTALAVFFILVLTAPGIRTRLEWMISVDSSIVSRMSSLRVAGWIISEHPITGLGPGQLVRNPEYLERSRAEGYYIDAASGSMKHLHNVYATIAAEGGVIGLALFLWVLVALGRQLSRGDGLSRALFWGYIGFLVGNLFDAQLMGPSAGMDFFFLAGLLISGSGGEARADHLL
ncbi:MAG: O-antigen ligase family protein [Candidatus Glassbacteria bacterium]